MLVGDAGVAVGVLNARAYAYALVISGNGHDGKLVQQVQPILKFSLQTVWDNDFIM